MKAFGFWVLFLFVGAALICLSFSTSGMAFTRHENDATMATSSRKLKQNSHTKISDKSDAININLEDYAPIDPVPSSMTSIRPGPIQHDTPLMPYIPKPSPPGPDHPKHDGLP